MLVTYSRTYIDWGNVRTFSFNIFSLSTEPDFVTLSDMLFRVTVKQAVNISRAGFHTGGIANM